MILPCPTPSTISNPSATPCSSASSLSVTSVPAPSPPPVAVAASPPAAATSPASLSMAPIGASPTYKRHGKSVSESLPNEAARRGAEREIAAYREFQQLSRQLLDVNLAICRQRPAVAGEASREPLKKTARAIQNTKSRAKIGRFLNVISAARRKTGAFDHACRKRNRLDV